MTGKLRRLARRLHRDDGGVALTEFAFAAPLLLVMTLGGLETANLALTHLRVSQIAMTVADNAGRVDTTIDEADIYEVFEGAELVGEAIDFESNGRLVLSSLEHNGQTGDDEGQMINWQRCMGTLDVDPAYGTQGIGRENDDLENGMGADGNRIVSAPGTAVMFVEVTYEYQPLIDNTILGERQIRYESAFNVRERNNQDITNTQGLAVNRCS